jgi:hypothetical protein
MWKLFPLATALNFALELFPLVLSAVLAGVLVLELLVLGTLLALVVAFEGVTLVSPGLGCWEGTAPFGTCGVTLGLMCDPLAEPEGVIGLGMFEDLADSERPEGFSLSFLFVLAMLSVRDQVQILARLDTRMVRRRFRQSLPAYLPFTRVILSFSRFERREKNNFSRSEKLSTAFV